MKRFFLALVSAFGLVLALPRANADPNTSATIINTSNPDDIVLGNIGTFLGSNTNDGWVGGPTPQNGSFFTAIRWVDSTGKSTNDGSGGFNVTTGGALNVMLATDPEGTQPTLPVLGNPLANIKMFLSVDGGPSVDLATIVGLNYGRFGSSVSSTTQDLVNNDWVMGSVDPTTVAGLQALDVGGNHTVTVTEAPAGDTSVSLFSYIVSFFNPAPVPPPPDSGTVAKVPDTLGTALALGVCILGLAAFARKFRIVPGRA